MQSLITIRELDESQLREILSLSVQVKENPKKFDQVLTGKIILQLFFESSTRTRMSFETAVKKLGGSSISFSGSASSMNKGETLLDTVQAIQQYGADAMVMRHVSGGAINWISEASGLPVINAGDGQHEHPTQALLDAFTLAEHWKISFSKSKPFHGKKILIIGDILHSRVARSNIHLLTKLGAEVTLVAPKTLLPTDLSLFPKVNFSYHLSNELLKTADAVIMLRLQLERQKGAFIPSVNEYRHFWGLTVERAPQLKSDAVILHPGPINRGIEIDSEVAHSSQSLILKQMENGLWVRMGVFACNS